MSRKLKIAACLLAVSLIGLGAHEGLGTRRMLLDRSVPVLDRTVENRNQTIGSPTQLTSPPRAGSEPNNFTQAKSTPAPSSIQVERITLRFAGFVPTEIRRPASPFVLAINNRTKLPDVSFQLFREDGHKLHEMKGQKGQLRQMKMIDLPEGNYLLKESNHPDWVCHVMLSR
jgi:hypothetical protein